MSSRAPLFILVSITGLLFGLVGLAVYLFQTESDRPSRAEASPDTSQSQTADAGYEPSQHEICAAQMKRLLANLADGALASDETVLQTELFVAGADDPHFQTATNNLRTITSLAYSEGVEAASVAVLELADSLCTDQLSDAVRPNYPVQLPTGPTAQLETWGD